MVGSIVTALLGWALVPHAPVHGWRAFLALASVPSLVRFTMCFSLFRERV
jgi:hypothetical protein